MKYTSAQAAKLLLKMQQDYNGLLEQEKLSKTFVASVGEDVESVRPEYSYEDTREQITELEDKIRKIKHAINTFNTQTVVPGYDMTIDEMLVYIPQLTAKKMKLRSMASMLPKTRDASYGKTNIIDYVYVNYDLKTVKADYDKVTEDLSNAQLALDTVNHSEEFEIDL